MPLTVTLTGYRVVVVDGEGLTQHMHDFHGGGTESRHRNALEAALRYARCLERAYPQYRVECGPTWEEEGCG